MEEVEEVEEVEVIEEHDGNLNVASSARRRGGGRFMFKLMYCAGLGANTCRHLI